MRVVATTEDLASLAREVGGDKVTVVALAKGYQDPHFVDPKPSFILEVSRADLLIVVGRELEIGWLPPLITSSRNAKIQPGANGYLDASANVRILEIPTGQITRAMGDVHPQGNPHYWLDPANGRRIAQTIKDKLSQLSPADRAYFEQRYADFDKRLAAAESRWDAAMAPFKGTKIVTYHRSWPNFMERFGLNVIGYVEPKPGIPPTTSHTVELIDEMKRAGREAHRRRAVLRSEDAARRLPSRSAARCWCWRRRSAAARKPPTTSSSSTTTSTRWSPPSSGRLGK